MNIKSRRYFLQLETWVKLSSVILASVLPHTVLLSQGQAEWPRHVATCALLLSWIELMFLLSRFPNWGYYVLMFGKVATNVIKVRLSLLLVTLFMTPIFFTFPDPLPLLNLKSLICY